MLESKDHLSILHKDVCRTIVTVYVATTTTRESNEKANVNHDNNNALTFNYTFFLVRPSYNAMLAKNGSTSKSNL